MANKTEKPTHKKLADASKKGQILKSRDLTVSFILLAGAIYLSFFLIFIISQLHSRIYFRDNMISIYGSTVKVSLMCGYELLYRLFLYV